MVVLVEKQGGNHHKAYLCKHGSYLNILFHLFKNCFGNDFIFKLLQILTFHLPSVKLLHMLQQKPEYSTTLASLTSPSRACPAAPYETMERGRKVTQANRNWESGKPHCVGCWKSREGCSSFSPRGEINLSPEFGSVTGSGWRVSSLEEKLKKVWESSTMGNNLFKQGMEKIFQLSR